FVAVEARDRIAAVAAVLAVVAGDRVIVVAMIAVGLVPILLGVDAHADERGRLRLSVERRDVVRVLEDLARRLGPRLVFRGGRTLLGPDEGRSREHLTHHETELPTHCLSISSGTF